MAQIVFPSKEAERRWVKREVREGLRGNCYVASEALYHILGGKAAGLTPMVLRLPSGETHWYLRQTLWPNAAKCGITYIDPSRLQFRGRLPNYEAGRGKGFGTKAPSKRARSLIRMMTWQRSL